MVTSCALCQIGSCANCSSDANYCDQCMPGLGLSVMNVAGSNIYSCIACPTNCDFCQSNSSICTQCSVTSSIGLSNGSCVACTDLYCLYCTNNASQCTQCGDGYGSNHTDWKCYLCIAPCDRCSLNYNYCERCVIGYGPYLRVCGPCRIIGCIDCRTDATLCYDCNATLGLGLNAMNNGCVVCADPHCYDCSTNYTICSACLNTYGLNSTNFCSNCSNPLCLNCSTNMINCV